ncbi:DUF2203 domain-containing protein [soil metagenome]
MGTHESIVFDVIGINRKSVFSLEEAQTLFPVVFRLTKGYSERVQGLIEKIEKLSSRKMLLSPGISSEPSSETTPGVSSETASADPYLTEPLEAEAGRLIEEWQTKIQKLGGRPNGHWVVDFDSGDGYYCWKYPERSIEFWHHYRDGYSKRIKLSALTALRKPPELVTAEKQL